MKKRSLKIFAMVMALTLAFLTLNVNTYAAYATISEKKAQIYYTGEISKPEIKISVLSSATPTLKVSWKKVAYANMYYIYRRDNTTNKYKLIGKTSNLYYKDAKVSKNTTYYYRVKACIVENGKVLNKSDLSSSVSKAIVKLDKVKNLTASALSDSKVSLSWDKVNGATRYYIYYSTSEKGTYKSLGYTKNNKYTISKLNASTTYYFMVKSAKVLDGKVYKSSQSLIKSAKTKNKDGEFIVDFKKISNKEAGLPTGSAITCLTMMFNHYGLDLSPMEVYEYFDCSTEFYTKNGRLYGPNHRKYFIGDPTSNKAYCYGAEMWYIGDVYKEILATNKNNIKRVQFRDMDSVKKAMCEGHIFFVRVLKYDPNRKYIFWLHEDGFTQMYDDEKYVILCGYNDTDYIVYDPYLDKYEKYEWTLEYNLFTSIFSIANE